VGIFPANPFGLFDMHGNIWEWCQDEWHQNYNKAPADGKVWVSDDDISDDDNRTLVIRGGAWDINSQFCRSASRSNANWPEGRDYLYNCYGFRVACSVLPRT
jgi:formylglycine-generating enzyme required for sulfatase activity